MKLSFIRMQTKINDVKRCENKGYEGLVNAIIHE